MKELEEKRASLEKFNQTQRLSGGEIELKERQVRITVEGDHYFGETNQIGERHGFGLCFFASGSLYEGFWQHDKPCG